MERTHSQGQVLAAAIPVVEGRESPGARLKSTVGHRCFSTGLRIRLALPSSVMVDVPGGRSRTTSTAHDCTSRFHAPADARNRIDPGVAHGPSSKRMRLASKRGDFERSRDGSVEVA